MKSVDESRVGGFTLVELLVTFALVAVMLTLAAPNFSAIQRGAELSSTANALIGSLAAARAEAMKRQLATVVMPVDDDWAKGWVVFVDADSDRTQSPADIVLLQQPALPASISVVLSAQATGFNDTARGAMYVMFNGAGFMRKMDGTFKSGSLDFHSLTGDTLRVIAEPAGRIRSCKPATDTGCIDTAL